VREGRVELPLPYGNRGLSPERLPFQPPARVYGSRHRLLSSRYGVQSLEADARSVVILERATGFEPATSTLAK
jgi:hypothetical protein